MRILFVFSLFDLASKKKPLRGPDHLQFGISYISAILKQHNHETSLIVLGRPLGRHNRRTINRRLDEFRPDLVAFTAVSSEYEFIEEHARYIRNRLPDAYLVIGGPHVTLNPSDDILRVFDSLCVGEGEYPMLELVGQLSEGRQPSGIPNLWIRRGNDVEKNPTRPFVDDLDSLPHPDRQMWSEWVDFQSDSVYAVLLGRGCPFGCTYCSNHALAAVSEGPYVRMRSPGSIVSEIRALKAANPEIKELYLEIESFVTQLPGGSSFDWAIEVCRGLEHFNASLEEPISFGVNLRVASNIDFDRLFEACKKSNILFVNIGLESGSDRVRSEVLNRRYSNDDIKQVVSSARVHGIRTIIYNMVGLPGETVADFQDTIDVNRECEPDWYYLDIYFPYPGTRLHEHCVANGWLRGRQDSRMERAKAVMDLPGFSRRQIQHSYGWFDYHVHRGKKPLWKILPHVVARKLKSKRQLFFLYRRVTRSGPLRKLKWIAKRA